MDATYAREERLRGAAPQLVIALQILVDEYMALVSDMEWDDEPQTPALSAAINLLEELDK